MIRSMHEEDFPQVYQLVKATDTLDVHTAYTYWVMSSISPELMLVAVEDGEISGFLGAFGPYRDKGTAFIWQLEFFREDVAFAGWGWLYCLPFMTDAVDWASTGTCLRLHETMQRHIVSCRCSRSVSALNSSNWVKPDRSAVI